MGEQVLHPSTSDPTVLNFFHYLGADVTNPMMIVKSWTRVLRVVNHAAALVPVRRLFFCLTVEGTGLAVLYAGTPEAVWDQGCDLSRRLHIVCE